jgi:hypothetical protein
MLGEMDWFEECGKLWRLWGRPQACRPELQNS